MRGVYLPGGRRVDLREVPDPEPGPGEVVLAVRASTICGSDLRAIYREHLGLIHRQLTVHGSWVAPTWRMAELLERLARWDLHPERVVTHRFPLAEAAQAYETADAGVGGKVGIVAG